jgi:predicted enzyme related to lactoylglutathione lyase
MYISVVTLHVKDIDRAIDFYTKKIGWEKTMDAPMGEGMRWVTVAPKGHETAFTLSADTPEKIGGMCGVIFEVDDVNKTTDQLKKAGIEFTEQPRQEPWGGWAVFKDSEGNEIGLHSPVAAGVSAN